MVRSICKVGLAMALAMAMAWVGLAWSQTPKAASNVPEATQAMMTVHENGKAVQCRILSSWQCANGARAFQLEVLATGEKLTIVEDGPGSAFQSQTGRMRTLPMRIFHWGRSKTPPAGAPMPPDPMISEREVGEPKIINESDAVLVRITPEPVAPPGSEICSGVNCGKNATSTCDCCDEPCAPCESGGRQLAGRNLSPYSPMQGSMSCQTTNIEPPAVAQRNSTAPKITDAKPASDSPKQPETARPAPPPLLAQGPAAAPPPLPEPRNLPPLPGNIDAKPLQAPASEPSQPRIPTASESGPAIGSAPSVSEPSPPAAAVADPGFVEVVNPPMQPMPMRTGSMPSKQPRGLVNRLRNAISPDAGRMPEPLTNRVGPDIPQTQGPQIAEMAQQPAVSGQLSKSPSPQGAPSAPANTRTGRRIPGGELPGSIPSGTQTQGAASLPINQAPTPGQIFDGPQLSPGPGNAIFPGQASQDASMRMPPGAAAGKPGMLPGAPANSGKPMTFPGLGGVNTQPRPGYPAASGPMNEQRDWRTTWGKPPAGQPQTPGQSLVEPTPSGKGPAFQPGSDSMAGTKSSQTMPSMPPASMAQGSKKPDPLLTPERFGTPRVESKTRGEARTKEPMPPMPPPVAVPTAKPTTQKPLGVQSVMAANNGLDMPLRYIPVPTVTVPLPVRPPGPPAPEIPKPPAPTDFVNAFSSPKPPENNGTANGPQNGQPMAGMASPYGPMGDPRMFRGPVPNMPYGPGPGMNPGMMMPPPAMRPPTGASPEMLAALAMFPDGGSSLYRSPRPVAQINYPRSYQGPMAPNPVGGNINPQAYMPALQPYYAAAPAYPPAPYAPQGYAPMPPVAVPMPQEFAADPSQLLGILYQSPYPAQREWAVLGLAALDLRAQPEILEALLNAARKDPAPSVRAGCIQCVARQNVAAQPVLQTLQTLKSDPDPRVRNDAEQALIRLTGSYSTLPAAPIQPVNLPGNDR